MRAATHLSAGFALSLVASLVGPRAAMAAENLAAYQGAWLTQGPSCTQIFLPGAKGPSFRKPVDIFAPAFIISGTRLQTPTASCRITAVKPDGSFQSLTLDCANSVSASVVKVRMQPMPDGSLRRYFDAGDSTGNAYLRCPQ